MKVLMIDDDPGTVEVVSLGLQHHWPEAKLVSTPLGEKGVEMVKSEAPDIVILDLGLPDVDGFEVLNQVRSFSNVPIIILSVRGENSDIVKGLELGADDYMVKPFSALELMARMRVLMRSPRSKKPLLAEEICHRLGVAGTSPAPIMKAAGAALGLRYDGFQKYLGHQFTDEGVTGSTLLANYPHELQPRLAAMRKKFDREMENRLSGSEPERRGHGHPRPFDISGNL